MEKRKEDEIYCEEIDQNEIERAQLIGKGSFGSVYKAFWRDNVVAVKVLSGVPDKSPLVEVKYLSLVKHPNIILLYATCMKGTDFCLVMEYAECGSLYNLLHCSKIKYTASHVMSWLRQCADGVAYLHNMSPKALIHRDLKPPNLLLVNDGLMLKICDFGTVTDKQTLMTNNKGSATWMAPEVFEGSNYSERCDVFSWSIILWECIARELPFKEIEVAYSVLWMVHKGQRPNMIEGLPKPIENLMVQCWDPQPMNRPPMAEVHERMKLLSEFFPEPEPLNMLDSYDDSTDEHYGLDTYDFESIYWPTDATERPQIRIDALTEINSLSQQSIDRQYLMPGVQSTDARWSSGDSSGPRIISSLVNNNGRVTNSQFMQPLNVEVDPNAWELQNFDYFGRSKNQGIAISKNSTTASIQQHQQHDHKPSSHQGSSTTTRYNVESTSINGFQTTNKNDLDAMLQILDPHLRPVPPAPMEATSQKIYDDHMKLAQEYFKNQTEIAYLTKHKDNLLQNMTPDERKLRLDYCNKLKEKEALLKLKSHLQNQLESVISERRTDDDIVDEDGFSIL